MISDNGAHLEFRLRLPRSDQTCPADQKFGGFWYPWWILKFEGVGYTKSNEEVDRAIKEAVALMLRALQADENSIPLNHDFVFYPQLSPELISLSTRCSALPTHPFTEQVPQAIEEIGRPPSLSTASNIVNPSVCPPPTADPNGTNFAQEGDLSDTTPSAESPVDRNLHQAFTAVPNMPMEGGTFPLNIPSYLNQVPSLVSYPGSGLEEVPPILNIGQSENVVYASSNSAPSFPVQMESTHFYPTESANTYDSVESLPVYVNPSFGHPKDPDVFVTLKVPAHAQALAAQFAHHLCTSRRSDPILIVPSDANTSGYMSVLYENVSFLCSRNGVGSGFSVMPIPATSSFLEVQNKPNLTQNSSKVIRAPYNGYVVVNPEGEMHCVQRPMVILPGNTQRPLMELPLLSSDGSSVQLDDIVTLLMHLREGAGSSGTSSSTTVSRDQSTVDTNYYSLPLNAARPPPTLQASHQSQQASFTRQQAQASINLRPPLPPRLPAGSLLHADLSGMTPSSSQDYPPPQANKPPTAVSSNTTRPQPNQSGQNQQLQQILASALAAQGTKADQVQQQQPQQQQMLSNVDYLISLLSTNPSLFQAILSSMCNSATPSSVPSQPSSSASLPAANTTPQSSAPLSLWASNASSIASSNDLVKQLLMRSSGAAIAEGIGGGYILQAPPHSGGGMTSAAPPTAPITSGVAPQQVPTSVSAAVQQVFTTLPPAQSQPHQPQAIEMVYEQNTGPAMQPLLVPTSPSSVIQPRMTQPTIAVPIATQQPQVSQQQGQIAANPPPQPMLQQQPPALVPQQSQQPPQVIQHQVQQPPAAKVMQQQQQPPPQQIHQVQQSLAPQVIQQQQQQQQPQSTQQVHQVPQHKPQSQAAQTLQPQPPQQHMPIPGSVGNQLVGNGAVEATKMPAPHKIPAPLTSVPQVQQPMVPPPHPPSQPVAMVSQPSPPQVVMAPTMPVAAAPPQQPLPPVLAPASVALIPPTPAQVARPPLPITTSPPAAPSKFVVSSVASVPAASATNVIGREGANSLNPTTCPPAAFVSAPQSSPSSQAAVSVVGNKFTVLPVDQILNQPIPPESTHPPSQPVPPSQLPPMASQNPVFPPQGQPPVPTVSAVAAPKKIPPKFTVTAVDDVSAPPPLPSVINGSNSLSLKAPQRRETLLKAVLDGDLSTECPPPPTTPSNVNTNSVMNTPTPSPPLCVAPPPSPPPPRKSIPRNPNVPSQM
ncbi:unnamed protein product [Rodentolepis nana]|uniref:Protein kinase domain-containing protein n=1 Tax=Rodentolepis nana TaxID=102285 RepID=A0A0R3TWW8_RODNA|nr:unnamed protein product [Rodentolepis nana]